MIEKCIFFDGSAFGLLLALVSVPKDLIFAVYGELKGGCLSF